MQDFLELVGTQNLVQHNHGSFERYAWTLSLQNICQIKVFQHDIHHGTLTWAENFIIECILFLNLKLIHASCEVDVSFSTGLVPGRISLIIHDSTSIVLSLLKVSVLIRAPP